MWLLAKILSDSFLNCRNTGRTTNQQNLVNIVASEASIFHSLTGRNHGTLNQISSELIKLSTGKGEVKMLRAGSISSDEWQVDVGGHHAGQLNLSLLSSLDNTLSTHLVCGQINAVFLLELLNDPVHNSLVEVIAAQMGITIGGTNLKHTAINIKDRYIEGTTTKVEYQNRVGILLINTIGQCSSSRLVDNTENLKACNLTSILGSLTLTVVEVCRNSDYCLGNGLTEISLCISLQLLKNHSRNLWWSIALVIYGNGVVLLAHVTLDGSDGTVRVGYSLTLCQLTYQTLTGLGEANYRWGNATALRVSDNCRLAAFHNGHNRVSCS